MYQSFLFKNSRAEDSGSESLEVKKLIEWETRGHSGDTTMVNVRTLLEDFWNMSLRAVSAAPGLQEF
jgi:hypothetical protein